jgi:hypothetical protein
MVSQICSQVVILSNCTGQLQLNVQNFPNFASVTAPTATNAQGNLLTSFPYHPGAPSQVVLVTSFYEWPILNISVVSLLGNLADGNRLLQSSAVFKNEPYPQM